MNTHINADSKFINKYKKRMVNIMCRLNPDWDKDKVEKIVLKMIKEQTMNPRVELDNNYTGENRETTLISVFDWALERKPLIAGNGTFYKTQDEALNPISLMLDKWAASRKAYKKQMFSVGETLGFDSYEYQDLDRS
jgi:hypothetical protein